MMKLLGYVLGALYLAWLIPFFIWFLVLLPQRMEAIHAYCQGKPLLGIGLYFTWLSIFVGINALIISFLEKFFPDEDSQY